MLSNAYFVAKIGADTAENEQRFAEILPTDALTKLRKDHAAAEPSTPLGARRGRMLSLSTLHIPSKVRRAARGRGSGVPVLDRRF